MAPTTIPNLDKLKSTLQTSGLSQSNNALFQVINQLIDATKQLQVAQSELIDTNTVDIVTLSEQEFLTSANDHLVLPNSRNLLAGTNILFNDTVANERTISATGTTLAEVAARVSVRV